MAGARPTESPRGFVMAAQVIGRDKLGVLDKIGQGGQGVVYRAPNVKTKFASSMVYKEYKAQALAEIDFTVLAAMPALVEESLSYAEAERLISIAAWPCRIVENGGTPTGFVMPAIPDEFFIPLTTVKGVSPTIAEFQHLLNHPSVLVARGITIDDVQRFTLLREVASGLAFMHKHGVCVGDISPKNLLLTLTPHEGVYFIDCDAMGIDGVSALPQVQTPGWEVPAGEELATIYSDTYKLGLLALRLLAGDHDVTNPAHLPPTTPTLLRQIITDTLTNAPAQRPLPEAWTYVLGHAIEEAQHHKLTTPPAPVRAASAPPPIPVVHSRPPIGSSAPPVPRARPVDRPPPETTTPPPPGGHRKSLVIAAGAVIVVAVTATVGYLLTAPPAPPSGQTAQPTAPPSQTAQPAYGPQVTLPFTDRKGPRGVAVDAAGNLYVTVGPSADNVNDGRVVKLAAGSNTPTMLPFIGLSYPNGVAVDAAGNLYVTDYANLRVLKLAAGSDTQSVQSMLPSNSFPDGVAVDTAGNLYVASGNQVLELPAAGSTTQEVLPFTGLKHPTGVAVDRAGNVYVTDEGNGRVVKLAAGSATQTVLPFTGLNSPNDVAVDTAGDLYVVDRGNSRVLRLAAGSSTPAVLPFIGLNNPWGVAVDNAGNLYVADQANGRVVKLAAG